MESIPPRDSRVLQTVDLLQQEILSGNLMGDIPGERELARRLRIGRVTLRAALAQLEKKKWISASQPGQRRRTLKSTRSGKSSQTTIASNCQGKQIVTLAAQELVDLPANERLDFARLNTFCSDAGITIKHRSLDLSQLKRPAHRLREFVKNNPAHLYLLQLASKETQLWFHQQQIPCIVLGSTWPGLDLSCVDYDQQALGLHAASTLSRLHHQDVGMLYPTPEKRGLKLFRKGFSAASANINLHLAPQDDSPSSVLQSLESLISDSDKCPTAIILPRIPYVITAISLFPKKGIRIPEDISLLCLVYDDVLRYACPHIAGYQVSRDAFPKAIFELAVKKLLHPDVNQAETSFVMPDFVAADSLANVR